MLDYGMGNIHSILKALRRFDPDVVFSRDADLLARSRALVLPGDGAFCAAMENLTASGLDVFLRDWAGKDLPLLGICIGFQVLFEDSTEDAPQGMPGLAILPGKIRRFAFSNSTRVPHMGWNRLIDADGSIKDYMYFVHSYHAKDVPREIIEYCCRYDSCLFPAAVRRGRLMAYQFHPEKSGKRGLQLLENWVKSI
ncbi:MAG: imidazole glycerol phosphate synthase subunit HisH [Spirochaetales bacterium]|nr:imidazole glycerol phosphate synthase subunit HisH [Spirochaetales bacterium]